MIARVKMTLIHQWFAKIGIRDFALREILALKTGNVPINLKNFKTSNCNVHRFEFNSEAQLKTGKRFAVQLEAVSPTSHSRSTA